MNHLLILVMLYINLVNCDLSINLEMQYFKNPNAIKQNKMNCQDEKCSTSFRFCIASKYHEEKCLSEFETQILGDNSINKEQFKMTTESIQFPLRTEQIDRNLILIIDVLNHDIDSENQVSQKYSKSLISRWTLSLFDQLMQKDHWMNFNKHNFVLSQELSFNYKIECFDNYYGLLCEKPVCSNDCHAVGGYCNKPNECICKEGWSGSNCDKKIDKINDKKCDLECKNGGVCSIEKNEKVCKCDNNLYKGQLCEIKIIQTCNNSTLESCQNGGSCLASGECLCPPGYAGKRCQTKKLNSQCGMVTCYNGGTCFIDNQNEYACLCHPSFTGKVCEIKITTETTTTTTTKIYESSSNSIKINQPEIVFSKDLIENTNMIEILSNNKQDNKLESNINSNLKSFSTQEIVLILILGIGMPVLFILIAIILYRRCHFNKNKNDLLAIEESKSIEKGQKSIKSNPNEEKNINNLSAYLKMDSKVKSSNFLNNNLFDKNAELNEKKIWIKTISATCEEEKQENQINLKNQDFKLLENNIYSIYNYDPSSLRLTSNDQNKINFKNLNKVQSNEKSSINMIATIV